MKNYEDTAVHSFNDVNRLLLVCSNLLFGLYKTTDELKSQLATVNIITDTSRTPCSLLNVHIDNFSDFIKDKWHHDTARLYNAIANIVPFESEDAYFALVRYSFGNLEWMIIHKTHDCQTCVENFSDIFIKNLNEIFNINAEITKIQFFESIEAFIEPQEDIITYTTEEDSISSALEYISQNYQKNLTLVDVAGHVFMSPSYFSMYFKKITHKKFIDHLTQVRMDKAAELLKNTSYSVSLICELVGYRHLGHFYSTFKKQFGITPAEYKKTK